MSSVDARTLCTLIRDFLDGHLEVTSFCDQFEKMYNLDLDKGVLSPVEAEAFRVLFDKIVWYSPYPEERAQIPNYVDEGEIRRAADATASILDSETESY